MTWSGTDAGTRRRRSWAPPMSSPPASGWLPVTSRAGSPAPSRSSDSWDSRCCRDKPPYVRHKNASSRMRAPPMKERFPISERPIIVFDVNETLLDLDSIRPVFDRIFGDPAAMRLWFANLITYSEALTLAGVYVPFTDIGGAVLRMLAATRGITISDADGAELTDRFATMPPHPEVPAALRRLRDHGFRLFTLTDNTLAISGRQLDRAGQANAAGFPGR